MERAWKIEVIHMLDMYPPLRTVKNISRHLYISFPAGFTEVHSSSYPVNDEMWTSRPCSSFMQLSSMGYKDDGRCLISDELRQKAVARRAHSASHPCINTARPAWLELSQFLFQTFPFHVSNQGTHSSITQHTIIEKASIIARSSGHRFLPYHDIH
jgi:hypothetical protein